MLRRKNIRCIIGVKQINNANESHIICTHHSACMTNIQTIAFSLSIFLTNLDTLSHIIEGC